MRSLIFHVLKQLSLDGLVLKILGSFWTSWGAIFRHFGGPGAPFGVILGFWGATRGHFVGLGVALGGSRATLGHLRSAVCSKDLWCLLAAPHFKRFWRPKGAQKAPKMELNSVKHGFKNRSLFWVDFS